MKNPKYISNKSTRVIALLLMLHLLAAPILALTPHINCEDECNVFMGEMNNSDFSDNQMNDQMHACCTAAQEENNEPAQNNNCDLIVHAIACEMTIEFKTVEVNTVTFKFDPKTSSSLSGICRMDRIRNGEFNLHASSTATMLRLVSALRAGD